MQKSNNIKCTDLKSLLAYHYSRIENRPCDQIKIMEVCGTHTVSINRFGLRQILPEGLSLISGPGCPVCVTPYEQVDQVIAIANEPGAIVLTFGDMMRVPGSFSTLERERANGCDIRVVYSAFDALNIAIAHPKKMIVFLGIGFETTIPTIAATLVRALLKKINNLLVFPAFKLIPPAMKALLDDNEVKIDGFLCPGHVSTIIGSSAYNQLVETYKKPCVVGGFDADDIIESLIMLLNQIADKRSDVEIAYKRAVTATGNTTAKNLMKRVFHTCDTNWRGLGVIKNSGLMFNDEFKRFNSQTIFEVEVPNPQDLPEGCACGEIMKGLMVPPDCTLFGKTCRPSYPVGPCMVSSEGVCSAYYKYRANV